MNGDFSPQFALRLALKDVRLALDAAGDDSFAALSCLADEWQQAVAAGLGDQDLTVVTQTLELPGGCCADSSHRVAWLDRRSGV